MLNKHNFDASKYLQILLSNNSFYNEVIALQTNNR